MKAKEIPSTIFGIDVYLLDIIKNDDKFLSELTEDTKKAVNIYNKIIMHLINKGYDLIFYRKDGNFYAKCLRCGEWLFSVIDVKAHFLAHENGNEKINPYGKVIKIVKDEETEFKFYVCEICGTRFIDKRDAVAHVEICHKGWQHGKIKKEVDEDAIVLFKVKEKIPKGVQLKINGKILKLEGDMTIKIPLYMAKAMEYYEFGKVIQIGDH